MQKKKRLYAALVGGVVLMTSAADVAWGEEGADGQNAESRSSNVDEIVVTARRREESILQVPIAVTAYSAEGLQQNFINNVGDLSNTVPGFQVSPNQGRKYAAAFSMRGMNTTDTTINVDPVVGVYVAEVPLQALYGINTLGTLDVKSVQILKGPQGTLFGRNSTGGAILITPNTPTDEFEGRLWAGFGSYNRQVYGGTVNLPISDSVALRVSAQKTNRDGLIKNLNPGVQDLNSDDNIAGRFSLRITPNDIVESTFYGDWFSANEDANGPLAFQLLGGYAGFYSDATGNYQTYADIANAKKYATYADNPFAEIIMAGLSNTTTIQVTDNWLVKNIAGYRKMDMDENNDNDATPFPILHSDNIADAEQVSEELQLQYESEKFNFILGAFYFRMKGSDESVAIQLGGFNPANPYNAGGEFISSSKSVFAQGTYDLTSAVSLTLGVRQTWDKRDFSARSDNALGCTLLDADVGGMPLSPCLFETSKKFNKPTWTAALDWNVTENQLLYVTARRGYRSGGFTLRATTPSAFAPFDSETVDDVELGYKGDLDVFGTRLKVNFAAYRSKYKNIQRTQTKCGPPSMGNPCPYTLTLFVNAADATIYGLENETTWIPVDGLEFSGFYAYTDAEYDTWLEETSSGGFIDHSQVDFRGVPIHKGAASVRYRVPYRTHGDIWLEFQTTITGTTNGRDVPTVVNGRNLTQIDGYALFNARAEWQDIFGSTVDASIWAKNLADKEYFTGAYANEGLGLASLFYGEPRTVGFDLSVDF